MRPVALDGLALRSFCTNFEALEGREAPTLLADCDRRGREREALSCSCIEASAACCFPSCGGAGWFNPCLAEAVELRTEVVVAWAGSGRNPNSPQTAARALAFLSK